MESRVAALLSLALALLAAPSGVAAGSKPNILHIVADDLGWQDLGFNRATDLKTPNLDALAKGGAKLGRSHVQPMCTPTRAALMTGRYPFREGFRPSSSPAPPDLRQHGGLP